MTTVLVPGPEPDWQPATSPPYYTGRNPASQYSLWWYAAGHFRLVAGLSPSLEALAARLRLHIERSWEDLGEVDVVLFRIQRIQFALGRMEDSPNPDVRVWLHREQTDVEAAVDVLLNALGIGREALTFVGDEETGFVDLRATPSQEA